MESYDFIDNIKAEKANALARYRTFSNISKLFQLLEIFVAVAVISWSSSHLPLVFKFSSEYVTSFSSFFASQHVVFLVGNLIVVVCYVLSRYSDSGNELSDSEFHSGSGTELTHRKIVSDVSNAKPVQSQAVRSFKPSEIQNPVILNNKPVIKTVKSESEVAGETVITPEMKRIERRFERARSEKVRSRIPVKADRELRRSVTEMRRSVAVTGGKESVKAVEKLSNEEFRIAVETFIMKQQRFLKEQSMIEDES